MGRWTVGKSSVGGMQAKRVIAAGEIRKGDMSQTGATSGEAGSRTMIKQKMSTAKHHSTKVTAKRPWVPVQATTNHSSTIDYRADTLGSSGKHDQHAHTLNR